MTERSASTELALMEWFDIHPGCDPALLIRALSLCREAGLAPPDWLVEAIREALMPTRRPGRPSKDAVHRNRHGVVRRWRLMNRRDGNLPPLDEAFDAVAEMAASRGVAGFGSADTIRKSYQRVERERKAG